MAEHTAVAAATRNTKNTTVTGLEMFQKTSTPPAVDATDTFAAGVVYSGMGPDSRVLIRKARKQAQAYYRLYKEHIPVAQLVREVAAVMQEYTRECNGC